MINYSISWSAKDTPRAVVPPDPLNEGIAAHRRRDLDLAIRLYLHALASRPNRVVACYNLAVALIDAGLGFTSVPFLNRAVMLAPTSETISYARLYGLIRSDRLEEAARFIDDCANRGFSSETIERWRDSIPPGATALHPAPQLVSPLPALAANEPPDRAPNLPTVTAMQAQLEEVFADALRDYQRGWLAKVIDDLEPLIAAHPSWGEGHHLRGLALAMQKRFDEAVVLLRRASVLLPGRAEIPDHLAVACLRLGDSVGARAAFEQSLTLNPMRAETWNNAADAALDQGALVEAFQSALQAVRLKPDLVDSNRCLLQAAADLERETGAPTGALATAVHTVKAGVENPEHALTIASLLVRIGEYSHAVEVLEGSRLRFGERPSKLLGELAFNRRHLCDWRSWEERHAILIERIRHGHPAAVSAFSSLSLPGLTSADLLKVARQRAAEYQRWVERGAELRPAPARTPGSRLRIGYLSADFQEHATAYLAASVFERHDRARFEVFAYSTEPDDGGPMRRRLRQGFEHFVDVRSMTDLEAAQRIRDDGIDILIDLKGYTRHGRVEILALRPCPLQVSWLAFPGTLGASFIDYVIVDPVVVPPDRAVLFDEALAYLPDAYAPVDDRRQVAPAPSRTDAGLPPAGFVFSCFNDPYKITPDIFDRWCKILAAVPDSVLWLYAKTGEVIGNLRQEAAARGVSPDRVLFAQRVPQAQHLARLALADLVLDTSPYNAHTTASDALWMGVPVLTCPGETFASRVAASLLSASGLSDLVMTDMDEYQARAIRLALNPGELASLKARLAQAREHSAFFDTARFTRNLEALYARIHARYDQGLPPALLEPSAV